MQELTDNIVEVASLGNSIGGVLVQGAKVLAQRSVGLDVEGVLLSED